MDYIVRILPNMISGLGVSAEIFLVTIVLSLPIGILLSLVRLSRISLCRQIAGAYIYLMRHAAYASNYVYLLRATTYYWHPFR